MQLDVYLPDVHGRRVVVDAKYKTGVDAANLQQMVTYCLCTGARDAVLVFPAGLSRTSGRMFSCRPRR